MALLPKAANTEENKEGLGDRSALPAGEYLVHIIKSEMKETKESKATGKGNAYFLSLHMKVLEGERKGSLVFTNLNLKNPNPVAEEIANKELNSICQACGVQGVADSEEIHQVPFVVELKVDKATKQYPESNSVTAYKPESDWNGDTGEVGSGKPGTDGGTTADVGDGGDSSLPWD